MNNENNDMVVINLDRPRNLKFTYKSLKMLSTLLGKTIADLETSMNFEDYEDMEKIFYCALLVDARENNQTLALEEIPELLDLAPNISSIYTKLFEAWRRAFPDNDQEGK